MKISRLSGALLVSVCLLSFISTATHPATVVQTKTSSTDVTSLIVPFTLNQFDPSLDTRNQVELKAELTAAAFGEASGESLDLVGGSLTSHLDFNIDMTTHDGTWHAVTATYNGDTFQRCSEATCTVLLNLSGTDTGQVFESDLTPYIDNGLLNASLDVGVFGSAQPQGFFICTLDTTSTLTYHFTRRRNHYEITSVG